MAKDILSYAIHLIDSLILKHEDVLKRCDFSNTELFSRHGETYLDAARSFLKEGLELLFIAFDERLNNELKTSKDKQAPDSASQTGTQVKMYLEAVKEQPEQVALAQYCFTACRDAAEKVFSNRSMSIKNRIMASELRMTVKILESSFDDLEIAIDDCLLDLEELHNLPVIQEMFTKFLKGGLTSMWKKAERSENIETILLINLTMFHFALKYSKKSNIRLIWPVIKVLDCAFNPISHAPFDSTNNPILDAPNTSSLHVLDTWMQEIGERNKSTLLRGFVSDPSEIKIKSNMEIDTGGTPTDINDAESIKEHVTYII